jgi:hypothetical protein
MTNRDGVPVVIHGRKFRVRVNPNQGVHAVAQRLTREIWRVRGGEMPRPLRMPNLGLA